MGTKSASILFLLLGLCCVSLMGQQRPVMYSSDDIQEIIDKYGSAFIQHEIIHAVSIGIYLKGKTYTGHFGELNKGKGNEPTDSTLYSIASVTKTMTGTLLAKAVLDEKINLDDDIRNYLPGEFPNLEFQGAAISVRHLLTHMSGLPSDPAGYVEMFEKMDFNLPYPKEAFFEDLKKVKLKEKPGTNYSYSNLGTIVLSYALENVYQKPFDRLMAETIFEKADMRRTSLRLSDKDKDRLVKGYFPDGSLAFHIPTHLTGAEGAVKSTLTDLLKYMKFQLDEENPIIKESHRKLQEQRWMGYFWQIWDDGDGPYYQHPGNAPGTTNWLFIFPVYDMGISVISNVRSPKVNNLLYYDLGMKILEDLRPSGKSIRKAINQQHFGSVEEVIAFYVKMKEEQAELYGFSDEFELNTLGYQYVKAQKLEDAIQIFTLNTTEFPQSANAFDSLADAYYRSGKVKLALDNYKKALALGSYNEQAKVRIAEIEGK